MRHIALQKVTDYIEWEIILIDNASTDDTSQVAQKACIKYSDLSERLKIAHEIQSGLSYAREKGITLAKYEYIIFCDDDNWLHPNYVQTAFDIISNNPNIGALGGQSFAVSTLSLPDWFENSKQNYAVGQQADSSGDVSYRKYLWGSGIVIRKEAYQRAYNNFPSLLTGRNGKKLSSGEDAEMCQRFLLMGYILYYSEDLIFEHYISPERLTENYNAGLLQGFIHAYSTLNLYAKMIDQTQLQKKERIISFSKSLSKVLIAKLGVIHRWNLYLEQLNIFMLTGYKFKSLDDNLIRMRRLSK